MNNEFKRMLELAGLTEIKVVKSSNFTKLKLPFDPNNDNVRILPPNWNDFLEKYDIFVKDLINLNPQINPEFFLLDHGGITNDVEYELSSNHPEGFTMSEFYRTYFYWLWANLVADFANYEDDEVEERENKYSDMRDEFADNAMRGRWLLVPGVTS